MTAKYNAIFHNGIAMISVGPFDSAELANEYGLLNTAGEDMRYVGAAQIATRTLLTKTVDAIKKLNIAARLRAAGA